MATDGDLLQTTASWKGHGVNRKSVLVTGGAGFIGGNLCRSLVADPGIAEVRIIDDLSTGSRDVVEALDVSFYEASINVPDALRDAMRGVDAVVHLAALGSVPRSVADPLRSHEANATGTLNVLLAAKENDAHVIVASSSSVYGANPAMPKVETLQCMPMSPYAVTKLATEQYAMAFAQVYGLRVLPFRFFNVFGPGQLPGHAYAAVVPVFMDAALGGVPLPVNGDGGHSRDFTFVGTVVEVIGAAIRDGVTAGPTNLAFGTNTTLLQLIQEMSSVLGMELPRDHRPPRPGDVRASQADNTQLRRIFPDIEPVSLREGLEKTAEWMREFRNRR